MNDIVVASQSSTLELQEQIDIYKENNRRELTDLQRLLKERGQELEKCLLATNILQEEVQCATSASSNIMGPQKGVTDLNTDTAVMVRVVKSRPSLVSPTEPSHAEQQMMSHSFFNQFDSSSQHHPLLSECDVITYHVFLLPAVLLNPKHSIKVKQLSRVKA